MQYKTDKTGELDSVFSKVIANDFSVLKDLRFIYVFRNTPKNDEEGGLIEASVHKLSPRDRDVFNYDVCIEVDKDAWSEKDKKERRKLAYHELLHVKIDFINEEAPDEEKQPKLDKNDRVVFSLAKHDVVIKRFKKELLKFGLSEGEEKMRKFLNKVAKTFDSKS